MQEKQPAYFTAYRSIKLSRDTQGVLVGEFHSNGGPLTFTASDHTDFVECFYRISQDRENKIVILTGTGGEFIRTRVLDKKMVQPAPRCPPVGAAAPCQTAKSSVAPAISTGRQAGQV